MVCHDILPDLYTYCDRFLLVLSLYWIRHLVFLWKVLLIHSSAFSMRTKAKISERLMQMVFVSLCLRCVVDSNERFKKIFLLSRFFHLEHLLTTFFFKDLLVKHSVVIIT